MTPDETKVYTAQGQGIPPHPSYAPILRLWKEHQVELGAAISPAVRLFRGCHLVAFERGYIVLVGKRAARLVEAR